MQEKIQRLGGDLNKENIVCQKCPELMHSGFDPDYGILLCANRLRKKYKLEDALSHGKQTAVPLFVVSPSSTNHDLKK